MLQKRNLAVIAVLLIFNLTVFSQNEINHIKKYDNGLSFSDLVLDIKSNQYLVMDIDTSNFDEISYIKFMTKELDSIFVTYRDGVFSNVVFHFSGQNNLMLDYFKKNYRIKRKCFLRKNKECTCASKTMKCKTVFKKKDQTINYFKYYNGKKGSCEQLIIIENKKNRVKI
jgi:hypothetical protein